MRRRPPGISPTGYTDEKLKWCSATLDYLVSLLGNEERVKREIPPSASRNRSASADDDAVAASVAGRASTASVTGSGGRTARGRSDSAGQCASARGGDVRGDVRGGARAARVQEDSETDNDITLAHKGNKCGRCKSVSRYPHFCKFA
jgi:hypothetical protein